MAHPNTSSSSPTATFLSDESAVLDAFIPGYSFFSRFLSTYLHIDLSLYLPLLFALTALAAGLKYVSNTVIDLFKEYCVSTAEIRLDDEMYNYLMFWISHQPFSNRTTRFVAGTKTNSEMTWYDYDSDEDEDEDDYADDSDSDVNLDFDDYWAKAISRDKYKKVRFTPSQGRHYFRYKGRLIAFTREQDDHNGVRWLLNAEKLYVSCIGRDPSILKDLLGEAQKTFVERDGNRTIIYRAQKNGGANFDWVRCMARAPRPLSTVVLGQQQKQDFIDDIKEYLHPRTRRWYSNRGIPYRRGYLLHGPPGTGKTSLCFAAAGLLGLKIYLVSLNSTSLNEDGLASLFQTLPRRCVVLLEDVDSAGIAQKRSDKGFSPSSSAADPDSAQTTEERAKQMDDPDKPPEGDVNKIRSSQGISLSALLNVIDGVAASEGRMLVMTTNHIEKLDAALLRPGRVDMTIAFGYSDAESIKDLFCSIYGTLKDDFPFANGSGEKKTNGAVPPPGQHHITALALKFASHVPGGEFTAAEVQGYLLKHKNEPEAAIEGADAWVQSMREKRKEKEKTEARN